MLVHGLRQVRRVGRSRFTVRSQEYPREGVERRGGPAVGRNRHHQVLGDGAQRTDGLTSNTDVFVVQGADQGTGRNRGVSGIGDKEKAGGFEAVISITGCQQAGLSNCRMLLFADLAPAPEHCCATNDDDRHSTQTDLER